AEPYLELQSAVTDVRVAADGEVMSIAHGMGEERIVRVRHDDETESIYGNLLVCYAEVGDRVYAGDIIARVPDDVPLAFELRRDGRSINPEGLLMPHKE
ncbi:MAG: M23 family metallopeptidase, partial [Clostridia bacterium]